MTSTKDPREKLAKQLLKRGHASIKEILTLSFGEWPPCGLDIDPAVTHDRQIILEKYIAPLGDHGYTSAAGDKISINTIYPVIVPTLGHEGIHCLQIDSAGKHRQRQKGIASKLIVDKLKTYDRRFHKNSLRHTFPDDNSYFKKGDEIQAYFHVALMAGYRQWGKMPQDQAGLWQALVSLGLKPPADIKAYLEALPPDAPSRAFVKPVDGGRSGRNFMTIDSSLSDAGRKFFWRETLPALYGDLIEMYGDRHGRERFGLDANTKGQIQEQAFGRKSSPAAG
jgi:hypothetical protein